ncbi:COG3650 family protein [Qipengyuania sp.]|uniref:COG3650 family protein n=1 Tax=Qipengyuania sp. TaxID=2004515 RepID=UPI0035C7CA6A
MARSKDTPMIRAAQTGLLIIALSAASGCGHDRNLDARTEAFNEIGPDDAINLTGTEPFWRGEVVAGKFTYIPMNNPDGTVISVERFAGNNGVAYSGTDAGQSVDLIVTKAECSDGMSDRRYPFTATLAIGEDRRLGCAWTRDHGFSGPRQP